ncbi:TPA: ABC transporter ATP-binding protein [Streptococcus pneumoniae]|nr:ABC transporter ATP-binding protein [Streptococcus pneumoniae]HEW7766136.1 ABC transporter ATP-binding protein [Streptococcus pneumoniae]HEW8102061.1 ABC transporter ATP-binding protein [Streptococcus pneumoniae]
MNCFLKMNNVSVRYDDVIALKDITLQINKGDFIGLLGSNGAGKSTLINSIVGFQEIYLGEIEYCDKDLIVSSQPFAHLGFTPQTTVIDFYTTVKDNVILGLNLAGKFGKNAEKLCQIALEIVGLADKKNNLVETLSGGQLQRVQIARAIAHNPDFYILDEPTVGLDTESAEKFLMYLKDKSLEGKTIIISSHDINLLEKFCKKILFLQNGSISFFGDMRDFVDNSTIKLNFSMQNRISRYQIEFLENFRFKVHIEDNDSFTIEIPIEENILDVINEVGKACEIKNFSTSKLTLQESYLQRIGGEK